MQWLFACSAKPKEQKLNQTRRVVKDLFTESQTSVTTKSGPHNDSNDDDILADMFSSSSKTKSNVLKPPSTAAVSGDILATEPTMPPVKNMRPTLQSKKASAVTNAFNIDDDNDDDIFAIKPSSVAGAKTSVAATGNATQKVCSLV